jgi:hypothetical protein
MKQLFVSYAREDRVRVEPLVDCLRGAGFEVFWDQSMPAGVDWAEFLDTKLGTAHRLVVLWTMASVGSRWVRTEADEAMQQNKLLPVLLDKVRPPLAFRQIHCFDLIGWQGAHDDPRLARLAGELHAPVGDAEGDIGSPTPGPTHTEAPSPTPAGRWALMFSAAGLALAWLAWLVYSGWQRGGEPVAPPPPPPASAASVTDRQASTPMPVSPRAAASTPAPSPAARRCAAIKDQISLGNPVSDSDRAFLQAGCR